MYSAKPNMSVPVLLIVLAIFSSLVSARSCSPEDLPSDWRNSQIQNQRYNRIYNSVAGHKENFLLQKANSFSGDKFKLSMKQKSVGAADALRCDECELVTRFVYDTLQNMTHLNGTAGKDMREVCRDVFKNKDALECEHIVDEILIIVNHLADELGHWQVNFPEIVCADVLKICKRPCCTSLYKPEEIRLSYASKFIASSQVNMTVSWVTLVEPPHPAVWWRKRGESTTWLSVNATRRTYTLGGWIGNIWGATMYDLDENSTFEYKVGDESMGVSEIINFSTLPTNAGTDERPLRVLAVADMGWGPNSDATIAQMIQMVNQNKVDFLVHPGDIGYADGDQHWWDDFGKKIQPISSRIPYMTVQGNHEQIWWNATGYKMRWWMPEPGLGAPTDATYYSLVAGPIKIFMLDTETIINTPDLDPVQLRWAKAAMQEADNTKFLFVLHHRPFYCSSYSISDCTFWAHFLRDQAEELYRSQGVDLVMVGHVHNYERTYPVYNGTVMGKSYTFPAAPVYVVNGAAGNREGQAKFYTNNKTWSAVRTMERGFMYLQFGGNSQNVTMHSQFIRSSDGKIRDEFTIVKKVNEMRSSL